MNYDLTQLIEEYSSIVRNKIFAKVSPCDQDDVYQDFWECAIGSMPDFRREVNIKTYFFGILRHTIFDHYRRKNLVAREHQNLEVIMFYSHWKQNRPDQEAERNELWDLLEKAISRLPEIERKVIFGYLTSLHTAQIAELHQLTPAKVRQFRNRATEKIKADLEFS